MLTQFFRNINWLDISLAVLFARVVFISVRTGFIAELFKFFAIICALFVSLHYYVSLGALLAKRNPLPLESMHFLIFTGLWVLVVVFFKFAYDGVMLLFKVESVNKGIDKYAAGFLGAARMIFLGSLIIFSCLLIRHPFIHTQVFSSWAYQCAAHAAPNTYKTIFNNVVSKLFEKEKFNADVFKVVSRS